MNIDYINNINNDLNDYNSKKINFKFNPKDEQEIKEFIGSIKNFGNISNIEENWIISDILNSLENKMKLKEWIDQIKEGIKTKLLFKLSRDGETIAKFHELCDNIKDNLIIIKAENKTIFGGYCTWTWSNDGSDIAVNDGFLFNLTKGKKYDNKKRGIHKGCKDHGPYFYKLFYFEYTMKKCNILNNDFSDNTGCNNIQEIEIYQII